MSSADLMKIISLLSTNFRMVDLSHTLEPGIPSWPTHARFAHVLYESYEFGDLACHYQLTMSEHTGTHVDAPLHFIPPGRAHIAISEVPLTNLFGRAARLDVSDLPKNSLVNRSLIEQWERDHGQIQAGDIVLFRFGWEDLWAVRPSGQEFVRDWPGLGREASEYLVEKGVKAVGTDALAIDSYDSVDFPAHYTLLGNQVPIIENLCNLSDLTEFSLFLSFPLKIKNGSGSPVRAVAFVPQSQG